MWLVIPFRDPPPENHGLEETPALISLGLPGEESPLLVAEGVIERYESLLCHQDSLSYLRVDDELLLAVAEVERLLDDLRGSLVQLQNDLRGAANECSSSSDRIAPTILKASYPSAVRP